MIYLEQKFLLVKNTQISPKWVKCFLYECLEVLLILSIKDHDTRLFLKVFKEITNLGTADKILDFFLRRKRVLAKYTKEKKHKAEEWNSVLYLNRTKASEKGKKTRPNRYPSLVYLQHHFILFQRFSFIKLRAFFLSLHHPQSHIPCQNMG